MKMNTFESNSIFLFSLWTENPTHKPMNAYVSNHFIVQKEYKLISSSFVWIQMWNIEFQYVTLISIASISKNIWWTNLNEHGKYIENKTKQKLKELKGMNMLLITSYVCDS